MHKPSLTLSIALVLAPITASAAPVSTGVPLLIIEGAAPAPLTFAKADFAKLPRVTASWTVHGKTIACEGPWLIDLLARAGVPIGDDVRGPALATLVVATAADGYRAVFTLGELDRKLGNTPVLVADTCEGTALPDEAGPLRIVAAGDERGARSVRSVRRITVTQLPATP